MAYNKGLHGSIGGSHRGRPYALILLIAFGAALLGVMVLHKLRERRIYNLLVKEKDNQLVTLQLLLQRERDRIKELRNKNEELKGKIYALRIQKMELDRRVVEMQSTIDSLRDEEKVMESAFEEKQNEIRTMQEKGINLGEGGSEITALRENLKQKEAEIQDLKHRLEIPVKTLNDPAINSETLTGNGTMAAEQDQTKNENKEKEEHSLDTAKYEGGDKSIINEDASKSKLTMFKDGDITTGVKDEIQNNEKPVEKNEDPQDDAAKGIEAEVVDGREKKAIREEQLEQHENNTNARDEDSKAMQLADNAGAAARVKRKHGRAGRTKGKRWKTIVKNKLMESNGNSESHEEASMGNRKVYGEKKGDLKGRKVEGVPDEENAAREDKGMDNTREDKPLKPGHHETKDGESMIVNDTNQQVTNNGINTHPERERLDEDNLVQQNWSRRHINKTDKDGGQTKFKTFHEEHEETEVSDVRNGNGDEEDNGDFFRDSLSDVEDEKEEYKEQIDESEFQPDL